MQIWVQYTLDLRIDPQNGKLILGGWATREMSYKFVASINNEYAGYMRSQVVLRTNETIGKFFIRELSESLYFNQCSFKKVHHNAFKFVFQIFQTGKARYDKKMKRSVIPSKKLIGLAIFIRTIPIHLADGLRSELRDLGLLPSIKESKESKIIRLPVELL